MPDPSPTKQIGKLSVLSNTPLLLSLLLLTDSLHFIWARLFLPYLPGGTSAFYVLAIATVELTIYMVATRQVRVKIFRENLLFFLVIGLLVAISTASTYIAVGYIDPGTASLLAQMTTIFALGLSIIWLREKLTGLEIAGAAIAVVGVVVISFQPGDYLRLGSLLILASALMYALHAAIVKRHGGEMDFANFFLFRMASVSGFLLLFTSLRGQLLWPTGQAWIFLLLAGTIDVVISRTLYYVALRRFQMSFHTIILTLSPVITVLWSFLLFGLKPTRQSIIGGMAVILGVAIVSFGKSKTRSSITIDSSQS
jgi:drug/metabolite transporter (DMT)-like permease